MGEVNHSIAFIQNFVQPVYRILVQCLQKILDTPLPATQKPSPFAILRDKGTIKHNVTQPTLLHCYIPHRLFVSKVLLISP